MKKVRNQKGFTLIELMATVAIIGVLAAIAIPNYMKYQRKARQAEAKVLLGSAFLSEKALQQDQHSYSACLVQAGFGSDAANNFYSVGFGANVTGSTVNCGPYTGTAGAATGGTDDKCSVYGWKNNGAGKWVATASCTASTAGNTYIAAAQWLNGAASPALSFLDKGTVTSVAYNSFVIGAAGAISDTANTVDVWQVDNNKTIYQTQDGTQ